MLFLSKTSNMRFGRVLGMGDTFVFIGWHMQFENSL